jgi:tRNA-binding protein
MEQISWGDFEKVELRIGTIIKIDDFPEAKKPAYKITVDFGKFGVKKSSAQITTNYSKKDLLGKQIIGVINFPSKQIGPFQSEFLTTGFYKEDGSVILVVPDKEIENGSKLG